jgi:hypothetical protein
LRAQSEWQVYQCRALVLVLVLQQGLWMWALERETIQPADDCRFVVW